MKTTVNSKDPVFSAEEPRQQGLPLVARRRQLSFIEGPFNVSALSSLRQWASVPLEERAGRPHVMALMGPHEGGKSRLCAELMAEFGGRCVAPDADGLFTLPEGQLAAIDGAEAATSLSLFNAYNAALAKGQFLLFAGRGRPDSWGAQKDGTVLKDLVSRLGAIPQVEIDAPDTAAMAEAIVKALTEIGVKVSLSEAQRHVADHLRRRFTAVEALVEAVGRRAFDAPQTARGLLTAAMGDIPDHRI